MIQRTIRGSCTALFALLAVLLLQACNPFAREPRYIMPEEATAREQFGVALDQERRAKGTVSKEDRIEEYKKGIAAYDAVISRFVSDDKYTPAAWIARSELEFDLGSEYSSYYSQAIAGFRVAADKYATQEDIRVAGLWGMGRSYDKLAQGAESGSKKERESRTKAQAAYKAILDEYATSESPAVQQVVEQARIRYRIVR